LLIDKVEKLRSCSRVAESAMMVFQVNVVGLAKIAKAVGFMAGITSPHSRAGAKLREAEAPFETLVFVRDEPVVEIVLNRKNALFAGHDEGAENWARVASLVETCRLNDVEPQAYIADVLDKLVNLWPASRIDELMPWAWPKAHGADRLAA
jgi:IS66 C-terminal element